MKDESVLIGSFIKSKGVPKKVARSIVEMFGVNKVFIFNMLNTDNKYLLTFNISKTEKQQKLAEYKEKFSNTIQLHRNKDTNTLYTINSLNKVIQIQAGQKNKDHKVNWDLYRNSLLLLKQFATEEAKLDVVQTKLCEVISF